MNVSKFNLGDIYGQLTIIGDKGIVNGNRHVQVRCDCGNESETRLAYLRSGNKKSCGCMWRKVIKERNTKHGDSNSLLYRVYSGMKERCFSKNHKSYRNYGGRGITVCEEWKDSYDSFKDWALSNGYKEKLTLDRVDNNGNYSPENCRWTTYSEQNRNTRTTVKITVDGETKSLSDWCEINGINYNTAHTRIARGWNPAEAVSKKPRK